jgi:PIN domain nuclease of toxin-antitoxin system
VRLLIDTHVFIWSVNADRVPATYGGAVEIL